MIFDLLVASTVRMSLLLGLALAVARVAPRWSAAARHCALATAVCGALLTPLLTAALPRWQLPLSPAPVAVSPSRAAALDGVTVSTELTYRAAPGTPTARTAPQQHTPWRVAPVIVGVWLCGVLVGALLLAAGFGRLARVARRGRPVTEGPWAAALREMADADPRLRRLVLLESGHPSLLVTWGVRSPRILLPRAAADWDAARISVVLAHEVEHIRRRDWLLQCAAEALRAVAWFNPLAWIAASQLRLESECACDDAVLQRGVAPSEYAEHLLHLARAFVQSRAWVPAPAMARPSSLERRVAAMLDSAVVRRPLTRFTKRIVIALGFAATVSIASFAAQSDFATFSGTINDQLGGTIPGATLTMTHAESGAKHEVKSDRSGRFEFVGLVSGNYDLDIWRMGFKTVHDTFQLAGGQSAERKVTLNVGTLEETISVVSESNAAPSPRPPAPPMPSAAPSPAACSAEPNSAALMPPRKIHDVRPRYAASAGSGRVVLQTVIGLDGAVRDVQTIEAANPELESAAIEAVRQWRFTQTLLNCVPVEVEMRVTTSFRASDSANAESGTRRLGDAAIPAPPSPPAVR